MIDYFKPGMDIKDLNQISALGLAHIGDAVYEICVRTYLCLEGCKAVNDFHNRTVSLVNANFQALAADFILPELTSEEIDVYKRGRNAKVNSIPQNSSVGQYHSATGLEALFGYLYLKGDSERVNTLFSLIMENGHGT